jgi:hypothetical protein
MLNILKKFYSKIPPIFWTALKYTWPFATALTLMSWLEAILHLSWIARQIIHLWGQMIQSVWLPILKLLNLQINPVLLEPLTLAILFLLSGVANNAQIRQHFGFSKAEITMPWLMAAYIFNVAVFFIYGILRALPALQGEPTNAEVYLLGCSVFAFVLTIILSSQKLLLRNILLTIFYVFTIIALDRIYEPLERLLS